MRVFSALYVNACRSAADGGADGVTHVDILQNEGKYKVTGQVTGAIIICY